ncbi:hypothetical protein BH10PSE12_BH10PSE12_32630 [soil metagenome]
MNLQPMAVRHLDLSRERAGPPGDGRAALTILWWRDLPLGIVLGSAEEAPLSPAAIEALLARFAAQQREARDPALGAPLSGGAEGDPRPKLTVSGAADAISTLGWLNRLADQPLPSAGDLSVIVCTRDRGEALSRCLARIAGQKSPPGELIVVDNSAQGTAKAICAALPGIHYVHEPKPGLSHARNAGIAAATCPLIAFTDDDVEPHPAWTGEVVRALTDSGAEAVTGLVLPTRLDSSAQVFFQIRMGGFGTRFVPVRYDRSFYEDTRSKGCPVWHVGAGANMAFRRSVFDRIGLFDTRLGAGASGCSEDSEFWYRIVATGGVCHYDPRAVVFHEHRADWPGLRRQMRAYLQGHVYALVAQADMFGDSGNIRRIYGQLPRYFFRTLVDTVQLDEPERRHILLEEFVGWLAGLRYLVRWRWRRAGPRLPDHAGQATS